LVAPSYLVNSKNQLSPGDNSKDRMSLSAEASPDVPRSTGRVLDLLEIVLAHGACNLTTAAERAALTPTTALRHLRALEARGYLERDSSSQFSAGPVMLRMAASLRVAGDLDRLVAAAQPILERLAASTGESTYLAVSDGRDVTYVATAESNRSIRHVGWVGQVVSLDGTAVGQAMGAPGTLVKRTGAVEPDITAISMSPGSHAKLAIALSVIGPAHRFDTAVTAAIDDALAGAANELCRTLGLETEAVAS
jgi:IclR family acetate operon transcriptional repressor